MVAPLACRLLQKPFNMSTNHPRLALLFATALSFAPVAAHATISKAMEFDAKVENAASIVVGKVISQRSEWDPARKWILTYSTFQVEKTLKGMPAQQVTIVTPGGTVGEVTQEVVGVPQFEKGDEHVVFVRDSKAGPTVLYLEQGAYEVVRDDRGDRIVKPLVSSAVLVDEQRGRAVAPESPRSLRSFEDGIRKSILQRDVQRMKMLEQKKAEESSIWYQLQRNKALVLLAIVGFALATWQFMKRS